jgi:hypothetical protein
VEQQLAVTSAGADAVGIGVFILLDLHALNPKFPVDEEAVGVGEASVAGPNGFQFGAAQCDARLNGAEEMEFVRGTTIDDFFCVSHIRFQVSMGFKFQGAPTST